MDLDCLVSTIVDEVNKVMPGKDRALFHEFLDHAELQLAIEFICDKIFEYDVPIPARFGKMLQVISAKLEIEPARSWWPIMIEEPETHQLARLRAEGTGLYVQAQEVFEIVKKYLTPQFACLVDEFLSHNELDLAIDELCHCLINHQIPISKHNVDTLRTIWLDMGYNPAELVGFNILKE